MKYVDKLRKALLIRSMSARCEDLVYKDIYYGLGAFAKRRVSILMEGLMGGLVSAAS